MADNARPSVKIRIGAVRVTGFRALRDVCVTLDPCITVLVGENNTGKSAFLEAMATALRQRRPVLDDLYIDAQGNRRKEFHVDLLLIPADGDSFEDQLISIFGNAILRDGDHSYVAIRTTGSVGADRSNIVPKSFFIDGWSGCENIDDIEVVEISGEKVTERHLSTISFALLEASRDLVDEMQKRSSRWGRLLAQRDLGPETVDEIEEQLQEIGNSILSQSPLLGRLVTRLDDVQQTIPTIGRVEIEPLPSRIDDLIRATDVIINTPEGPKLPLRMQGLGSRSLAEMMVYRAFADELSGIDEPYTPHLLACFEEPEAHLHPHAQRAVMNIITKINGQCIVTTHSPQIASEVDFRQIRLFRYSSSGIEIRSSDSLKKEDIIKALRMIQRSQAQDFFFARLVIFGDGLTEYTSLPIFAQAYWKTDPAGKGITFVDPSSLGGAGQLIRIIEDLGIPWLALVDDDQGGLDALKAISNQIGRKLTKSSKETIVIPNGMNYEKCLTSEEGLLKPIKQGIANMYGAQALSDFRKKNPCLREKELIDKFLDDKKGTYGAAIAEAIINTTDERGNPVIPKLITKLFKRADRILETREPL